MPPSPTQPICPSCAYDLSGLIKPGTSATCPECSTESTFAQAIDRSPHKPSNKRAAILLLVIPSAYSLLSWAQIHFSDSLEGMVFAVLMFMFLNVYLPVCALVLFVIEWKFRAQFPSDGFNFPSFVSCFLILLFTGTSELLLWLSFSEWVEAAANV